MFVVLVGLLQLHPSFCELQTKLLVSTCLQNVMVLVLKRAFNLHTSFPATCTMHKCIMSRAYFRERRVDYESTVLHFHVPVPQLCLCDVGGPRRILFLSPPFNGLWAIVSLSQ